MSTEVQTSTMQPMFPFGLYSFFAVFAGAIFLTSLLIPGPFIFGDEAGYFNLARRIALHGEFSGAQYNPLYPLLLSPFFYFSDPTTTLIFTKAVNALVYASIAFPLYMIANRLFADRRMAMLATAMATLMPAGAYSYVILAEALYYPLIAWVFAAVVLFYEKPTYLRAALLGFAISLSFFAKQAGLLVLPAIVLAFAIEAYRSPETAEPRWLRKQFVVAAMAAIAPALWILRNRIKAQGGGGMGYQEGWNRFAGRLHDLPGFMLDCIGNLFYSLSYYAIALHGVLFLVFVLAFMRLRLLGNMERILAVSLVLFSFGLAVLSAVFFTAYGMEKYPNGRYFDAVMPILLLFSLGQAVKVNTLNILPSRWSLLALVCLVVILISMFSPLNVLFAYTFVNNASISFLQEIFGPGMQNIIWSPYKGATVERNAVGVGFGILAALVFLVKRYRVPVLVGLVLFQAATASLAYINVINLGQHVAFVNNLYKGLAALGVLDNRGQNRPLYFDRALQSNDLRYFMVFWSGSEPRYIDNVSLLAREWAFDFGVAELVSFPGVQKVPAPWRPESVYDQASARPGFLDISSIQAGRCKKQDGEDIDWIVSDKPVSFRVDVPQGRYRVHLRASAKECPQLPRIAFELGISGTGQGLENLGGYYDKVLEVVVRDSGMQIDLAPTNGAFILLDDIVIARLDKGIVIENNSLVVTKTTLPLARIMQEGELRVYAVR